MQKGSPGPTASSLARGGSSTENEMGVTADARARQVEASPLTEALVFRKWWKFPQDMASQVAGPRAGSQVCGGQEARWTGY